MSCGTVAFPTSAAPSALVAWAVVSWDCPLWRLCACLWKMLFVCSCERLSVLRVHKQLSVIRKSRNQVFGCGMSRVAFRWMRAQIALPNSVWLAGLAGKLLGIMVGDGDPEPAGCRHQTLPQPLCKGIRPGCQYLNPGHRGSLPKNLPFHSGVKVLCPDPWTNGRLPLSCVHSILPHGIVFVPAATPRGTARAGASPCGFPKSGL